MVTESQLRANQENAKLSAGPTSDEGKAISARNATKTGLWTAPFNLIAGESQEELQAVIRGYFKHIQPEGPVETGHLETAIRNIWLTYRYDRIEPLLIEIEVAKSGKPGDLVYAELLASPKNNTLRYLIQKRNQAQNTWTKAMKEIERLQKLRGKQFNVPTPDYEEIGFVPQTPLTLPANVDVIRLIDPDIAP